MDSTTTATAPPRPLETDPPSTAPVAPEPHEDDDEFAPTIIRGRE
ncbi:hypothetical protein [Prauserella flavalba]|nr:hypothetical protein [Prauserella flavalba]